MTPLFFSPSAEIGKDHRPTELCAGVLYLLMALCCWPLSSYVASCLFIQRPHFSTGCTYVVATECSLLLSIPESFSIAS